jgi:hypothetical protein
MMTRPRKLKSRRDLLVARALTVGKLKLVDSTQSRGRFPRWLLNRSLSDLVSRRWE